MPASTDETVDKRVQVYFTPEQLAAVRRVREQRGYDSDAGTVRWLVSKALDWWESLPDGAPERA